MGMGGLHGGVEGEGKGIGGLGITRVRVGGLGWREEGRREGYVSKKPVLWGIDGTVGAVRQCARPAKFGEQLSAPEG